MVSGKTARAAARARRERGPTPLALLSRDEREFYVDILVEGQSAGEELNRALAAAREAERRVVEARGALFAFALRAAKKRGLDVRAIRIEPDGRVLPAIAEVEAPPSDDGTASPDVMDEAVAELNAERRA